MFRVAVLLDSISPAKKRLTTFRIEAPRVILAELNTHRVMSKSAASSRAVPTATMLKKLRGAPDNSHHGRIGGDYYAPAWGKNQKGMQAGEPLPSQQAKKCMMAYDRARFVCADAAEEMDAQGAHKQDVNRLLEPFSFVRVIITSSRWSNFFALRTDEAAYPPFRLLARAMYLAYLKSVPQELWYGHWHLPFIREADRATAAALLVNQDGGDAGALGPAQEEELVNLTLCRWSSARCARVSYETFERKLPTPKDDDDLWQKLMAEDIKHASPTEHPARPLGPGESPALCGNFDGWVQFRKTIPGEHIDRFEASDAQVQAWEGEMPDGIFAPWGDEYPSPEPVTSA